MNAETKVLTLQYCDADGKDAEMTVTSKAEALKIVNDATKCCGDAILLRGDDEIAQWTSM